MKRVPLIIAFWAVWLSSTLELESAQAQPSPQLRTRFAADPTIVFPERPLEWEKKFSFQRTAIVRYPFQGENVYSEAARKKALSILSTSGRTSLVSDDVVERTLKRDLISESQDPYTFDQLQSWAREWEVDGIWIVTALKRGKNVDLKLQLFNPRLAAEIPNAQTSSGVWLEWGEFIEAGVDLTSVERSVEKNLKTLLTRMSFDGNVLSRQGKNITLSLGTRAGLIKGNVVVLTRIAALKKNAVTGQTDNLILEEIGRAFITSSDENLSFATIQSEKDEDPVLIHHKVVLPETLPSLARGQKAETSKDDESLAESVAFGKEAAAWTPRDKPSLGQASLLMGLGSLAITESPSDATIATRNQNARWMPAARLGIELWISKSIFLDTYLQQSMVSVPDPDIATTLLKTSHTHLSVKPGFRYLVSNSFDGPQIRLMVGYSQYRMSIDASSSTTQTTSKVYTGLSLAADTSFPVYRQWSMGIGFERILFASLTETPKTSGETASSQVWSMGLFGLYTFSDRWQLKTMLRYDNLISSFSGAGTRTIASQTSSATTTTLFTGINYSF